MKKTNALRALDAHKIQYETVVYDQAGEFHSADEVAELIGVPVEEVYKTLVVLRDTSASGQSSTGRGAPKPLLVMVAADRELDLRALAKSTGDKKLRMATKKEAEELTSSQIGGISALALLNRGFQVCIDQPALQLEMIHVSGGVRGLDVKLKTTDLLSLTNAKSVEAT